MYSKTPTGKASKGTVSVSSNEGRLRLSLPRELNGGQRKYITLGLPDTLENRVIAEGKALQANLDIRNNEFDFTLERYKLQRHLAVVQQPVAKPQLKLDELWERYVDYRRPNVSPSTFGKDYRRVANWIKKFPSKKLEDAIRIRDFLVNEAGASYETWHRLGEHINACCNWAVESGLIDNNPFTKLFTSVKKPKIARDTESEFDEIKPFTVEERDRIIAAFETDKCCSQFTSKNKRHSNYAGYIKFLFFTGCRPSEAIALQWKHITSNFVIFDQAVVKGVDGLVLKKGLKTQEKRRFPINNQLQTILNGIKPKDAKPDDWVFPSPVGGKWINVDNFCQRVWKPVLEGLGMEYRKPYNTRHTFITMYMSSPNANVNDAARICGTGADVILEHYLGNSSVITVPTM